MNTLVPEDLPEPAFETVGREALDLFAERYCLGKPELVSCAESAFYWFNKVAASQSDVTRLSTAEIEAVKSAIHGIDYQCGTPPSVARILRALLERQK